MAALQRLVLVLAIPVLWGTIGGFAYFLRWFFGTGDFAAFFVWVFMAGGILYAFAASGDLVDAMIRPPVKPSSIAPGHQPTTTTP